MNYIYGEEAAPNEKVVPLSDVEALLNEQAETVRKVELLRDVLRFYASESNWKSPSSGFALQYDPELSPIKKDGGNLARLILAIADKEGRLQSGKTCIG